MVKTQISININKELNKQFGIKVLQEETTKTSIILKAIQDYINK